MKGLDFKDWEKISEDKKSTTLKHSKGHVMVIAHGALPKIQKEQLKRLKFADGTPSGTVGDAAASAPDSDDSSSRYSLGANIGDLSSIGGDSSYNDMIKAMAGSPEVAAQVPGYTGQAPYQGPAPVSIPQVENRGGDETQRIVNTEQQGVTQGELIAAEKAKAEAAYQDQFLKETQALKERDDRDIHTLNGSVQTLHDYVKEYPMNKNAIFDDMKAPARITNAIGLLIGGFTGGFNGTGVNPAMNYLMDQQNKDIQAQRDRMDQQRTVFGAFHKAYGDDVIASNLARVSYNNMLIHKGLLMSAKLGTPQSAQAANMLSSALNRTSYKLLGESAQRARAIHSGQIPAPQSNQTQSANVRGSNAGGQKPGPNVSSNMEQQANGKDQGPSPLEILTPDAEYRYNKLAVKHPLWTPEQVNKASDQYTQAKQAEAILKRVPEVYEKMDDETTPGGYLQRTITPEMSGAIGEAVGPAIGAAAGLAGKGINGLLDIGSAGLRQLGVNVKPDFTGKERDYQSDENRLITDFASALRKTNVGESTIRHIVQSNRSELGDSDENKRTKLNNMINELRQMVPTDALEAAGMAHKRQ